MKRLLKKTDKGYVPTKPLNSFKEKQAFLYNLGKFAGTVEDLMEKYKIENLDQLEDHLK